MIREPQPYRKGSRPPRTGRRKRALLRPPPERPSPAKPWPSWPALEEAPRSLPYSPPVGDPRSASAPTAQKIVSAHKISRETTTVSNPGRKVLLTVRAFTTFRERGSRGSAPIG